MAKDKKAAKKKAKGKAVESLKSMAMNPMVQEVVAAALVATAAALKDTKKARAMAEDAGDQLRGLAAESTQKGKALWALALEVARRAGDIVQDKSKAKPKTRPQARPKAKPKVRSKVRPKAKPKASARPKPAATAARKAPRKKTARS